MKKIDKNLTIEELHEYIYTKELNKFELEMYLNQTKENLINLIIKNKQSEYFRFIEGMKTFLEHNPVYISLKNNGDIVLKESEKSILIKSINNQIIDDIFQEIENYKHFYKTKIYQKYYKTDFKDNIIFSFDNKILEIEFYPNIK